MDLINLADGNAWWPRARLSTRGNARAIVSNGGCSIRAQASGLQVCQVAGDEAKEPAAPGRSGKKGSVQGSEFPSQTGELEVR